MSEATARYVNVARYVVHGDRSGVVLDHEAARPQDAVNVLEFGEACVIVLVHEQHRRLLLSERVRRVDAIRRVGSLKRHLLLLLLI